MEKTKSDKTMFEIKRVVYEYYYVEARSKKEALEIVGIEGGPSKVIVAREVVTKSST